jgi:adenine/guanine/hypoxanthine permease
MELHIGKPPFAGYRWAAKGDLNAFFALMLDNVLNLVVLTAILAGFGYPTEYVYKLMIPGTALGVLVGDLVYTWMAIRLAHRTENAGVTAMPLGLDTPSTIGVAVLVLGPTWLATRDAILTWQVGMATMMLIGVVKVICSFVGDRIRRAIPAAGLIGSLAGVGLALLATLPLFHIFSAPVVGLVALGIVLYGLMAKGRMPAGIPAAFAAVAAGTVLWHLLGRMDLLGTAYRAPALAISLAWPLPSLGFVAGLERAIHYLPVAIPFGILTIVGGINVTESARLAGDHYKTRDILLTEAVSTLIAGVCGGVVQSTPYIGHPAYKEMGGRAAYTLATGLFIGVGGCLGYVPFIVDLIPAAAVTPILVFIGLEILNQGYHGCPAEHAAAVGLALLPCVMELLRIVIAGSLHVDGALLAMLPTAFQAEASQTLKLVTLLGHGFIITAMLWGAAGAFLIDLKVHRASLIFFLCAILTSCGMMHSSSPEGGLYLPWLAQDPATYSFTAGYLALAAVLFIFSWMLAAAPSLPSRRLERT